MCPSRSDNLLGGEVPRRVCGSSARYHEAANRVHKARVPADAPGRIPSPSAAHPKWIRRPSGYGKALPGDRLGQLRDARRSVVQQMHRYYIPKFDPRSCIVSSVTGPSHAGLTAPAAAPHLSLRGGHIGTGDSAVTDVTDGAISRRRSQWRISRCNPRFIGISLPLLT
jgi:hypothetical protein